MEKERFNHKKQEDARYSTEDEEQVLSLNELMDVQGGIEDKEIKPSCGLGCFSGAVSQNKDLKHDAANE